MIRKKTIMLAVISALLLLLILVVFVWSPSNGEVRHNQLPLALKNKPIGGDFTVEILNADLQLKDLRGKTLLLYFGYTRCPDISPLTLSTIADVLEQLTEQELDDVQALFVSIDPERDNTARLAEYSANFQKNIIAATAEPHVIEMIAQRYAVSYEFVESGRASGPIINHSSAIYIINKSGELSSVLPYGTSAETMLESVREHLNN